MQTPPTIANSGRSSPANAQVAGRPVGARERPGLVIRSRVTETWAIVNDSIAPNAYRLPRNVAWPGIRVSAAIALNRMIPTHGVP